MKTHHGAEALLTSDLPMEARLPIVLLAQYLFFLTRRPVSSSNSSYLHSRLRGLQTLCPYLEESDSEGLAVLAKQLTAIRPSAIRRVGSGIQLMLLPYAKAAGVLPTDIVVEDGGVPAGWLDDVKRVLLILGPGIGIGDELIVSPLPRWLKQSNPNLTVSTLSAYGGVWDSIEAVDDSLTYKDHRSLVEALRGNEPYGGYDLIILADFEAPELYRCLGAEARVPRYLEISLGGRSAFLLDNERRWLHRNHLHPHYHANYYDGFNQLLRELQIQPQDGSRFTDVFRESKRPRRDHLQIFVSPFTSKYEPSAVYWNRLIVSLLGPGSELPVRIVLDRGANAETAKFASNLRRSLAQRLPSDVDVAVAAPDSNGRLSLAGVFAELSQADVALCTDSFVAHASAQFDCAAIVVAGRGLEDWRVPRPGSFYLDADAPAEATADASRQLLQHLFAYRDVVGSVFSAGEAELVARTTELERLLDGAAGFDAICGRYEAFLSAHDLALKGLSRWETALPAVLAADWFVSAPRRLTAADLSSNGSKPAVVRHVRYEFERWRNTNYCKLLRASCARMGNETADRGPT